MTKRKKCKICKEYSGKRNICKTCKDKFPSYPSGESGIPFDREKEFKRSLRKK